MENQTDVASNSKLMDGDPGEHGKPYEMEVEYLGHVDQYGFDTLEEAQDAYAKRITSGEAYDEIAVHNLVEGTTVQVQQGY